MSFYYIITINIIVIIIINILSEWYRLHWFRLVVCYLGIPFQQLVDTIFRRPGGYSIPLLPLDSVFSKRSAVQLYFDLLIDLVRKIYSSHLLNDNDDDERGSDLDI